MAEELDALDVLLSTPVKDISSTDGESKRRISLPSLHVEEPEETFNVFVYGSLLSGSEDLFYNHRQYLQSSSSSDGSNDGTKVKYAVKVGDAYTEESSYVMLSQMYKNYPYVLESYDLALAQSQDDGSPIGASPTQISGEVWKVNAYVLSQLDGLEGVPKHYCRKSVSVIMKNQSRSTTPVPSPIPSMTNEDNVVHTTSTSSPRPMRSKGAWLNSPMHRSPKRSPVRSAGEGGGGGGFHKHSLSSPMTPTGGGGWSPKPGSKTGYRSRTETNSRVFPSSIDHHGTTSSHGRKSGSLSPTPTSTTRRRSSLTSNNVTMMVQMYLLAKQDTIDHFASSLIRSASSSQSPSNSGRDDAVSPLNITEDCEVVGNEVSKEEGTQVRDTQILPLSDVTEVLPLGDWRTFRSKSYENEET